METHNMQQILDKDDNGHCRVFDNGQNFNTINKAHMKNSIEMLLKGYVPIKREICREGEEVDVINGERLNKYCEEFRTKNFPYETGISFYYTTSAIEYKSLFSDETVKKIFIERTPWMGAFGAHGRTALLDVVTEEN